MASKQTVAYHEAGHAIAHIILDVPFDRISIVQHGDSLGSTHHPIVTDPDGWNVDEDDKFLLIDKHVMICLAGGFAQEKFDGVYDIGGASQDHIDAVEYASRRCGSDDESEAYLNWLHVRTRDLINHPIHWFQIQRLAEALVERCELSSDEARKIYANAADEDLNLRLSRINREI